MERLSKEQLNCIGIICVSIATLMLILVIVLPIMLKTKKTNDFTQKSTPSLNNTDLWAKFPGDIHSNLTHSYYIFDYKLTQNNDLKKSYKIEEKTEFSITEEISYDNFFNDEAEDIIYFNTNRTYIYNGENKDEKIKINSINMGLFETLETMTHPNLYKEGINSIYYLIKRVLIDPDLFIRELFTYKLFNELDETIIRTEILKNISGEKVEKILSDNDTYINYSFASIHGFFEWIKIMENNEKIHKANWLVFLFELNETEISSILENEDSYLIKKYNDYNLELSYIFKCENIEKCGIDLIYQQLINGSVISTLFPTLKDYLSLNKELKTNYYPFDTTPELNIFFEKYKEENGIRDIKYIDYSPSKEELDNLINSTSENCLLSPNNSIYFIYINKTDSKHRTNYQNLTNNKIILLSKYFYEYLPMIFFYPEINNQNSNNLKEDSISVDPVSKTVLTMTQDIIDKTYKLMLKINLYKYVLMKVVEYKLNETIKYSHYDEICPIIIQQILNDGNKTRVICADKRIGFKNSESLYEWIGAYYCFSEDKNETRCNKTIINILKELVAITEDEIYQIFSEQYLGGAFNYSIEVIKNNYKCGDRCEEKDYLKKLQFWTGIVSSNAPEPLKRNETIQSWFPDILDYPIEISFYQHRYQNDENYTEEDIDQIIKLISDDNIDKLDLENSNSFVTKLELEKIYTIKMNSQQKSSLYNLINFLVDVFVFKRENYIKENEQNLITEYSSLKNLLQGNNEEDKKWVNYLKSGDYFNNFKPNIDQTTGFVIGIDLDTKEQNYYDFDNYGISTRTEKYGKRRIVRMNNLLTLNIKKHDYDYLKDDYIKLNSPIINFESLLGERQYSDGFQYDHDMKTIYYYDIISARPLRFKYQGNDNNYKDKIKCKRYDLEVSHLSADINEKFDENNKYSMLTQKVNKPFMISADFDIINNLKYKNDLRENKVNNYICVDPITDMVIDSEINIFYGIYSRNFGFINNIIENEQIYPIFSYQRKYDVEVESYEKSFPGVSEYYKNMTVFIIIGVIVIVICIVIAVLSFYFLNKKAKQKKVELKNSLEPLTDSEFKSRETDNNVELKKADN